MTPAQRQQASRAKRLSEKFESFPAKQINILLSPQATKALDMLTSYRDKSQKVLIEELLIHAYAKQSKEIE
jgi:lipopolysaccharide biosynthesis regulator YciM